MELGRRFMPLRHPGPWLCTRTLLDVQRRAPRRVLVQASRHLPVVHGMTNGRHRRPSGRSRPAELAIPPVGAVGAQAAAPAPRPRPGMDELGRRPDRPHGRRLATSRRTRSRRRRAADRSDHLRAAVRTIHRRRSISAISSGAVATMSLVTRRCGPPRRSHSS